MSERLEFSSAHGRCAFQGCDSGFGHELAQRLSQMGATVFAGVLDANGAGAQRLREQSSDKLQILQLDVTDGSQIEAARRHISTQMADKGSTKTPRQASNPNCPLPLSQSLCCCRFVGFGEQRGNPSVSRGCRGPANHSVQTLHGRELPGSGEDVSGVPPSAEEVQRSRRQHIQPGR